MSWLCELSWVWVLACWRYSRDWSTVWAVELRRLYPLGIVTVGEVGERFPMFYNDRLTAKDSVGWVLKCFDGPTILGEEGCGCWVIVGSVVICNLGLFLITVCFIWLISCPSCNTVCIICCCSLLFLSAYSRSITSSLFWLLYTVFYILPMITWEYLLSLLYFDWYFLCSLSRIN